MIKKLKIVQFVIIDRLDLDFDKGLTILTGETGAGKSILLDATGLMLGEPADFDAIRTGSEQSVIEALFAPPPNHPVWKFLTNEGLVDGSQQPFTVQRTLKRPDQDEIIINGKKVDAELLKKMGAYLVEIHGQFANQTLLAPSNQLTLLDLSGAFPPEIFKNVSDALHEVHRYTRELEEENEFQAKHKREAPKIEEIVGRFERVGMKMGFIEEVMTEHARLRTAKDTSDAFQDILAQLIAANGVVMGLQSAVNVLERHKATLDADRMEDLNEFLYTALDHSRAAVKEMRDLAPLYDIDTAPLLRYEDIIATLKQIAKESRLKFEDLDAYYTEMATKRSRIRNARQRLAELQDLLIKAKNNYRHHAGILTEKRRAAGKALGEAVNAELPPLKLPKAEFQVVVEDRPNLPWTELGLNEVIFMARMNPGQSFSPVADTASGGELARLILALKVVVQRVQTIPSLIFDEVDTGIGGAAAAAVGERIALLAEKTQVMAITHSPQVAARNDQHLHVSKKTDGVTTTSIVRKLTLEESTDEISRMLAGDEITPESHAAAKKLIDEAKLAGTRRRNPPPPPPEPPQQISENPA